MRPASGYSRTGQRNSKYRAGTVARTTSSSRSASPTSSSAATAGSIELGGHVEPADELAERIAGRRRVDDDLEQHELLRAVLDAVGTGQPARPPSVTVVSHGS